MPSLSEKYTQLTLSPQADELSIIAPRLAVKIGGRNGFAGVALFKSKDDPRANTVVNRILGPERKTVHGTRDALGVLLPAQSVHLVEIDREAVWVNPKIPGSPGEKQSVASTGSVVVYLDAVSGNWTTWLKAYLQLHRQEFQEILGMTFTGF